MEYVYLLGITYPFGELNIMGIYTDKKMLIKAYDKLIAEDARCNAIKNAETPDIYKIQLNKFLGENTEWATINGCPYFYADDNIEAVSIDEVKSRVRIAGFYGMNVYCDLNFVEGAYVELEYIGEREGEYCLSKMNIEDGEFDHINMCCRNTVECWYKDNRKYLIEIYETRKIIDIPEW